MALTLNQFSTELSNTTSTGLLLSGNLTFDAAYWRIDNDGTVPVRLTLASTGATTGGYEIRAGESRVFDLSSSTSKFALSTTSSSTEDQRRVRVMALGG